jgi:hypothetical protein
MCRQQLMGDCQALWWLHLRPYSTLVAKGVWAVSADSMCIGSSVALKGW